ncbi:MAG: amidohydrolase [Calditrichaeota bacterium]|nr:MAG: amidohydrolase [Calditrichota bacterium]
MDRDLKIALVQSELHWQKAATNRAMFETLFQKIEPDTDVVVLPEMFTTGFTMHAATCAETMDGQTVAWIRIQAQHLKTHICGSIIIQENKNYYNRLLWATPDGKLHIYDKRHLFRMAGEHHTYAAGNRRLIVHVNGWKICPFICYDLRFPVWIRAKKMNYDAAIFVANWPAKRSHFWKMLLPARAVENQIFVIGVNRVGKDGNGFSYSGDSTVIAPNGEIIAQHHHVSGVFTHLLSHKLLQESRENFPAWQDADDFELKADPDADS